MKQKLIVFLVVVLAFSGCVQEVPESPTPTTTVSTVEATTTTTTTTTTTSTTTTLSLDDIRATNQREYYDYIEAHYSEFEPYLKEGKHTKIWASIKNKADEVWNEGEVYTNESVKDYIVNSLSFVRSIRKPNTTYENNKASYNTIPAHEVLDGGYGNCDEQAVLLKSMLISKGIPTQIRIIEGYLVRNIVSTIDEDMVQTDEFVYEKLGRHSPLSVFISHEGKYQWVTIDPTVSGPFGNRKKYHKEEDITETRKVLDAWFLGDVSKW